MSNGIAVMSFPNHHSSVPVPIPASKLKPEFLPVRKIDLESSNDSERQLSGKRADPHRRNEAESSHGSVVEEEEEFRLPDGSPTFAAVMSEMSSHLSKTSVSDHVKMPVLSIMHAQPRSRPIYDVASPGSTSPESLDSPSSPRKVTFSTAPVPRARSYSWNHRNKTVVERRKALSVSFQFDSPSSNNSSPAVQRKKKTKPRPFSSIPAHPKYKILSENIAVSHEDLVKEQEREHHSANGFSEVKSIFQSPWFDRLGISPTQSQ